MSCFKTVDAKDMPSTREMLVEAILLEFPIASVTGMTDSMTQRLIILNSKCFKMPDIKIWNLMIAKMIFKALLQISYEVNLILFTIAVLFLFKLQICTVYWSNTKKW